MDASCKTLPVMCVSALVTCEVLAAWVCAMRWLRPRDWANNRHNTSSKVMLVLVPDGMCCARMAVPKNKKGLVAVELLLQFAALLRFE